MWQGKVTILANEEVAPGYFRMVLPALQVAREAKAGQFIQVRVSDEYDPLLRRPLSIHRIGQKLKAESLLQDMEILYEVVGKGTRILAQKQVGEELDILGPLGKGFNLPGGLETAILIAGGIGVAPLLALAEKIAESGKLKVENTKVLVGARTKGRVLGEDDFRNLGAEVRVATDDGSQGYKGLATDLLKELLSIINHQLSTVVYACGPKEMLREIAALTVSQGIPCQLSLENQMGCGVGACRGCVIKIKNQKSKIKNYKRVCKDGPVFEAGEIIWE
ncbi:dihydroorotate dehydrogenase electron transfer subunit [candidate division NPL-UPA2 bacterium]|nr:dihydroorotate dehydrogenase electron transfer subunit [candidate division NPL-UPA2 bacterium]